MLANKQWVERKALGDRLVDTIGQLLAANEPSPASTSAAPIAVSLSVQKGRGNRAVVIAAVSGGAACLILAAAHWLYTRPAAVPPAAVPQVAQTPVPAPVPRPGNRPKARTGKTAAAAGARAAGRPGAKSPLPAQRRRSMPPRRPMPVHWRRAFLSSGNAAPVPSWRSSPRAIAGRFPTRRIRP